jgi:hypothetical protein
MYDEDGLFLVVMPVGGRWWRFKYKFERRVQQSSLGTYPEVPPKRAREKRDECALVGRPPRTVPSAFHLAAQ